MSKLSFRARALDASKPMPIYLSEELPDLPEYLSINRAVPQMPSGMEKEEETERHLQEAITTGKVIPTPEVFGLEQLGDGHRLERLYPPNYRTAKQLIHYQSYAFDTDVPEYDLDSEDERWINVQAKKMDVPLSVEQFEEMMDRLEKGSGQQVVTLKEAKLLLKEDDDLIVAVYDYWLNKRLRLQHSLIPAVRTEKSAVGAHTNNPYVAFRRRLEKMQTRKNRKNDEVSYEKMLKLRRDLSRAVTILEMIKRREKMKKEYLHLTVEVFEKRYSVGDYSGQVLAEVSGQKPSVPGASSAPTPSAPASSAAPRPAFAPLYLSQQHHQQWATKVKVKDDLSQKEKRSSYKKRKHSRAHLPVARPSTSAGDVVIDTVTSDEEEPVTSGPGPSSDPARWSPAVTSVPHPRLPLPPQQQQQPQPPEDPEPDGEFTFRRLPNCDYLAPLTSRLEPGRLVCAEDGSVARPRHRYSLASLRRPKRRCLGLVRQRIGRGGRVILDRAFTEEDDYWRHLDFTVLTAGSPSVPHFHPPAGLSRTGTDGDVSPTSGDVSPTSEVRDYLQSLPSGYRIEGWPVEPDSVISASQQQQQQQPAPLTVHMVPGCPAEPAPDPDPDPAPAGSSVFSVTPVDRLSELIVPCLLDSDGGLVTSGELSSAAETVDWPPSQRAAVDCTGSAPPPPAASSVQWPGQVLLADTPPALEPPPAHKSHDLSVSVGQSREGGGQLVPSGSGVS